MLFSPLLNSAARRRPGRPPTDDLSRLIGKHFLYRTRARSRCVVCGYKKKSSRGKVCYKDKKYKPNVQNAMFIYVLENVLNFTTQE